MGQGQVSPQAQFNNNRGLFEDHERVGLSRKFEQSNRRLLTAYLLLYRSVEAYKLLNLPLNC